MEDEACDPTVPCEETWQFEQRRAEVRRWMVIAGLTHDAALDTGVAPRFPLLEDLVSENTRGPLGGRAPSTEYMAFTARRCLRRIGQHDKDSHLHGPSCHRWSDARQPPTSVTDPHSSHRPGPRTRSRPTPRHRQ